MTPPKKDRLEAESRREAEKIVNYSGGSVVNSGHYARVVDAITAALLRAKKRERARALREVAPKVASALIGVRFSIPPEGQQFQSTALGNLKTTERVLAELMGFVDPRYALTKTNTPRKKEKSR